MAWPKGPCLSSLKLGRLAFEAALATTSRSPGATTSAPALQAFAMRVAKAMSHGNGMDARSGWVETGQPDEPTRDLKEEHVRT